MKKEELKQENEKKKEYLKSYLPTVKAAKRIEEEIEVIRQAKMYPSMTYDDMPHSCDKKDLSDYMCALDELQNQLIKARYKRVKVYTEIFSIVELMDSEIEREVLKLRYLQGMKWEDVCCELGYSWKQIHRYHSRALNNFKMT